MLNLSRRVGESIMIGDDVTITVLQCRRGFVRIGVDAPRDVDVDREEIYLRKQAEKNDASPTGVNVGASSSGLAGTPVPVLFSGVAK